jgi:hypothetical protein
MCVNRKIVVHKDIFEDSWVMQEWRREGAVRGLYQVLLEVVQIRFPEIVDLTKKQIEDVKNPESLQDLLVKISCAQGVEDATFALFALDKTKRRSDTGHDEQTVSNL